MQKWQINEALALLITIIIGYIVSETPHIIEFSLVYRNEIMYFFE